MKNILIVLVTALTFGSAFAGDRMTNQEMKKFYTGKTISAVHFKKGPGKTYYAKDGSARSLSKSGEKRVGKWWVDEDKNMRCIRWDHKNKDFCRYTEKNKDGTHTLVKPKNGKRLIEFISSKVGEHL